MSLRCQTAVLAASQLNEAAVTGARRAAGDQGSVMAPSDAEARALFADVGLGVGGVSALVVDIQRATFDGDAQRTRRLTGKLLVALRPSIEGLARQFTPKMIGSLSYDDLVQVGGIAVLKFIPKFEANRGYTPDAFQQVAAHFVRRAMLDHVRLHAHDVAMSEGAQRGRVKKRQDVTVSIIRMEGTGERFGSESDIEKGKLAWIEVNTETPEMLLEDAQLESLLRRCINRLPHPMGDLVAWVHGIGREKMSLREIAREWNQPRARLDAALKQGEKLIKAMVERELRARTRR